MRKGSDLIGKLIVAYETGERIERVEDLIFDQSGNRVLGFLVDEGGWTRRARVLPLREVQSIGVDAIVVPSKRSIVNADRVSDMKDVLQRNKALRKTKLMTTDGRELGQPRGDRPCRRLTPNPSGGNRGPGDKRRGNSTPIPTACDGQIYATPELRLIGVIARRLAPE